MAKWIVIALVALTALNNAATDSPRKCSQGCKNAPQHDFKFNLQPGHTYVYNFEATTETSVPGAAVTGEDEKSGGDKAPGGQRIHISGQAELHAGPGCDHVMQLLHVQVTAADGKKFQDFASCERHPLGFSWNNGHLGDELCVEDGDTPVNVNVKRAILSLIQMSKVQSSGSVTLHETDIFGTCPTDFTYHEEGGVLKVTKRRNLNRCGHREGFSHNFFSSYFDGPSDFQSTPLLQSSLQVEQTIKDKILVSAVGQENYLFRPFANGASGAHTTVTTRLTLVKHQPGAAPAVTNGHASSVLFDSHKWNYGGANPEDQATVEHVMHVLKAAEKSLIGGASPESAGLFRKLTRVMRYASSECLMGVYSQVKAGTGFTNKKLARAVFLDALLQTGTGQSIEAVVQLINAKDVPPEVSRLYYAGFSFIRHATLGSLKAVASLLESPSLPPEAYLGAGALVGRYCSEHHCDDSVSEYKILLGKLAHKLGKGCKPLSRVHENEIVGALKGLQNAKTMTSEAADAVVKCAVNVAAPTRVRVAALDAFRGDACNQKLKKAALEVMKNRELDSELRIKAYLAVTECPCEQVANAIKEMMDDEPIYQVGSFVSSHLISLRTSSNADNANAKHFLAGIRPKKRYPFDATKFSRAYEMSYSLDGLNLATSAEGNVIFSQKSFVPRSANLNLTTSLFGHAFNLFEVGVRAENVDFVLESLLGPRGYFNTHSPNEVIVEGRDELKDLFQHIKERAKKTTGGKGKRVARHATREMVDALGKKVGHSADHDDHSLDVDVHMKLFGSEVGWANYHGNLQNLAAQSVVDKFFDTVDDGINKAKDFKLDISPNVALVDTQLVYPTGAGFALVLDAAAHSSVDLKVESQIDILALLKDPGNAKFHMKLLPSASVEVTGSMFVDAFSNVMAGLQVVGNVHSSTGLGVDVQVLEGGKGVEVKLGVPKPKQDIFSFHSQVMTVRREKGQAPVSAPLKFNRDKKAYHGCFEQLTPLTGLIFCGDVAFPWDGLSSAVLPKANQALFPLDGPVKASLHVEKESDALTHYYFRALYTEKGPHKMDFEMKFDTPNTKVDRAVQIAFEADTETDKVAKVHVKTPWIKFGLEGAAICNQKEHSLMGKYISEGNEYMAKVGLIVKSASGNKKVYTPTLEVVYPEKKKPPGKGPRKQKGGAKGLNIEGTITIEKDDAAHKHVYTFDGVHVVTPKGKFGVDGSIGRDDLHTYSTDMKLKYDDLAHYFALKGKLHESISSRSVKDHGFNLEAEFTANQFPSVGFHLKLDSKVLPELVEYTFDLVHGPDLKSDVAHLHISNMYALKYASKDDFHVSVNNKVTYPLVGLEGKLQGEVSRTHVHYDMEVKYDKHKVDSNLDFKFGKSYEEGYDFKWGVVALGTGFQLDSKRVVTSPKNSKFDLCLELKPGGRKYELQSDLTHSYVGAKHFDLRANTVLKVPGHENFRLDGGAAMDAAGFKTHLEAHVGQVCHVNLRAHGELDGNGLCKTAEWSALLLNHLQGSGHYSSDAKSNKGDFVINLLKSQRKMKGEYSSVHPGDETCKTVVDFFWNADKEPNKKLHIESVNTGSKGGDSFESKNKIVVMDETTLVDFKLSGHGTFTSGNTLSLVDVHLPSGRHISFKSQATLNLQPSSGGDGDSEAIVSLCDKHTLGESCLKIHEKLSNFNLEKGSYVGSTETTILRYDGKDLKFGMELKVLPKDEKTEISGKVYVGGSLLGPKVKPISVEWNGEKMKGGSNSFHVIGKVGHDQSLGVKGSMDYTLDGGKTNVAEFLIEAHTQIEGLKHISYGEKGKLTVHSPEHFDLIASSELKWDQKLTTGVKVNRKGPKGFASVTMCLPGETEDHGVTVEWNHDVGTPRVEGSVALMWPQGKKMKVELQATTPKDSLALHLIAYTPIQGHEKMELLINHRNLKAEHALETDVTVVASPEHKTTLHSRLEFSQHKRILDLSVARQGGPTNKVHARLEKKGDNHFECELKADWSGETLIAESSLRFSGIDDFALHGYLDSTALKVKKWSIDIASKEGGAKGAKGGKKVVFTAKKAEEVVFQGSTSFSRKQEGNTLTYDGVGQLKIGDDSRNANFKLFTKTLSAKDNGESGVETKLNLAVTSNKGDKYNVVGEAKLSNKELRFYNSLCKGSDCSFVEAYSKVNFEDLQHDMDHEFAFILDVEKTVELAPFSVKGNTHRTGDFNLDHKVEILINKGKSKYSYHLYLKEEEAGAFLVLPKRTLAAVGTLHEGKGKNAGGLGDIHADLSVWLDKERHPELKTSLSFFVDVTGHDTSIDFESEAKLTHPSLGKDLAVRSKATIGSHHTWFDSKLELDIFAKKDQMVVMNAKLHHDAVEGGHNMTGLVDLKSKGQNIDAEWVTHAAYSTRTIGVGTFATYLNSKKERKDTGVLFRASPEALYLLVKAPSHEIVRADVKMDISKAKQVLTSEVCLFGKHIHVDTYEFHGLNSFKYSSHEKGSPHDQFQAHGTLVWGKALEMHAERLKGGQKEVLAHLTVALDQEHFFDVKHTWEQAHIKTYLSDVKNDYTYMVEEAKKMVDEMGVNLQADGKAFLELLKKTAPNVKALLDSYKTQLNEFKEEILSDEHIHQIVVSVENAIKGLREAFSKTIDKLHHVCEEFSKVWNQYWEKVIAFYEKIMPMVRESVEKIVAAFVEGLEKFNHYAVELCEKIFEFMQQFSGEFKAVGKVIVQFIQDVARTIGKLVDEAQHRYEELRKVAAEHLKTIPAFDMIKEYYQEIMEHLPETVYGFISEVIATLKESAPTEELKQFLDALESYLKMKLFKTECDDEAELKKLYTLLVKAVKSLEELARAQGHDYPTDLSLSQLKIPFWPLGSGSQQWTFSLNDLSRLPFFFAARASPFFYKLDDFPSPSDFFFTRMPSASHVLLPPYNAHGFLVGGEHFFTFDNRHYTLSGCVCDYVLAQDFEDGNFSITAHFEEGKLLSITLMDAKEVIELSSDQKVKVNGQPTELPVRHNTVSAWTEYDSISIKTVYGARVTCDKRFKDVCSVSVNGYYFGKTRGLLGTLNNEPHDDFIMPSGKIAPSVDKLANSWKADASCGDVTAQTHVHEHVKQCSDMFAGYSSMRICFPFANPAPFREACDAHVAMTNGDPCKFASAYAAACYYSGIKVQVPNQCAQCMIGGSPLDQGHSVNVKVPQGKADILLVVEQVPQNEALFKELIVPLVVALSNDLKAYKITDVKFVLIGYGGQNQKWPSIYTANGQVGFDGKGDNVKFTAPKPEGDKLLPDDAPSEVKEFVRRVERLRKLVNVEFGLLPYADAYQIAREYPFRPGAAKTIVALTHSRCLYSPIPFSSQAVRLFFQKKQYEVSGISFHVLSPMTFTSSTRDKKQIRQIVGLDKNGVFSLPDAKKKVLDGDTELRKDVSYDADLCVDFAQATNGGAYSTRNFAELPKPGFKKQFMQVVSLRIVQSLSPELTEDCKCSLYHGWHPVTRCRVTSRKESARLTATKTIKG